MTLANHPKNQKSDEGRLTVQMFLQPNHEGANTMKPLKYKPLTYEEVTKAAEDEIIEHMRKAESQKNKIICASLATGAYFLWLRMTVGFRKKKDHDRLKALAHLTTEF